jgi:hypothetical protein
MSSTWSIPNFHNDNGASGAANYAQRQKQEMGLRGYRCVWELRITPPTPTMTSTVAHSLSLSGFQYSSRCLCWSRLSLGGRYAVGVRFFYCLARSSASSRRTET